MNSLAENIFREIDGDPIRWRDDEGGAAPGMFVSYFKDDAKTKETMRPIQENGLATLRELRAVLLTKTDHDRSVIAHHGVYHEKLRNPHRIDYDHWASRCGGCERTKTTAERSSYD
jgi:hypothetical protein